MTRQRYPQRGLTDKYNWFLGLFLSHFPDYKLICNVVSLFSVEQSFHIYDFYKFYGTVGKVGVDSETKQRISGNSCVAS